MLTWICMNSLGSIKLVPSKKNLVFILPLATVNVKHCLVGVNILDFWLAQQHTFCMVRVLVLNATFNNILFISWRSVLLVEKTGVPGKNHWPVSSHWQIYHIMVYCVHLAITRFELTTLVVIGTDCIGSYKSNCHTITTMTVPHTFCRGQYKEHSSKVSFFLNGSVVLGKTILELFFNPDLR